MTLPADAPTILGPGQATVGRAVRFQAQGSGDASFVWNPEGDAVQGPTLDVTPGGAGSITLVLQETRADGRVLRVSKRVDVKGT